MKTAQIKKLKDAGHLVDLHGKDYITHAGLLEMAHADGIASIISELVSWDPKQRAAVVIATATGTRGTFTGLGDANPENVGRNIATATLRMAETRAVNRALRSYLGVGMTTAEEMPGDAPQRRQERPQSRPAPQQGADRGEWRNGGQEGGSAPQCPACQSALWDNTEKRAGGWKGPAWKCRGRDCTGNNGEPWLQWESAPTPSMVDQEPQGPPQQADDRGQDVGPPDYDDSDLPF
jgi:hypothetical protein